MQRLIDGGGLKVKEENNNQTYKMRNSNQVDKPLAVTIFALVIFGLVMIFSAGIALSLNNYDRPYYFFYHQLLYGVIPGLILWVLAQNINYKFWKKNSFWMFIFVIILLVLVLFVGERYKGSTRWLNVGPVNIQPTEIAKLVVVLYLGAWMSKRKDKIKSFSQGFIPFCFILLILSLLIIVQPDVGTLGLIVAISVLMFFMAKGRISHLLLLFIVGILLFYVLIQIEPYRMARLQAFRDPGVDPTGIGWQVQQAKIAIGSGGLWGNGLGHGRQKFLYLPEPIGDSIFAIICEELGMIGGVFLIGLFYVIAWRGLRISKQAPDEFSKLVAGGITVWFVLQAFMNIAAITSLIPLTGIPLPFVSYGSSALIISLVGAGILLNISKNKLNQ
ncbi:MAG: putative lipid II flippase FtsW [Candidatus Moranbacteria bacterium]|nr:putative lipid II flippase FtsW [Candidatus Moranbacteria bacterium]